MSSSRYRVDKLYAAGVSDSLETDNGPDKLKVGNKDASVALTTLENRSAKPDEEFEIDWTDTADNTNYRSSIVAVILSYGKNGVPEEENGDGDATYAHDYYLENRKNPSETFDDKIAWVSKYAVIDRLLESSRWPFTE